MALTLAPLLVLTLSFGATRGNVEVLQMPLFIAGAASMFVSLPLFGAYKRALVATQQALDSDAEPAAWIELAQRRRIAFLGAGLPAWIAAAASLTGLNAVALVLLALSSIVLLYLYRIPRQLG
nr:MFS transporter [Pseudomonas sp. RIT-PI-AD]